MSRGLPGPGVSGGGARRFHLVFFFFFFFFQPLFFRAAARRRGCAASRSAISRRVVRRGAPVTSTSSATTNRAAPRPPRPRSSHSRRCAVVVEQAVPVRARTQRPGGFRHRASRPRGAARSSLAVVDLVAAQRGIPVLEGLVRREHDIGVEQTEAPRYARRGLHRVIDAAAQHLEAAADAEHRVARTRRAQRHTPMANPLERSQPRSETVALVAGEHDDVSVGKIGRYSGDLIAPAPRPRRRAPRRRWRSWRYAETDRGYPQRIRRRAAAVRIHGAPARGTDKESSASSHNPSE